MHSSLDAMKKYPQWVCWELRPKNDGSGKSDKVPINPRVPAGTEGRAINPHTPAVWMPADTAEELARVHGCGVGFVFTEEDPFFFLDLDDCIGKDGQADELAAQLLSRLTGAAVEYSISGRGLHVFGRCAGDFSHAKKNVPLHIELYRSKRFVALGSSVTGGWADGDSGFDCLATLPAIAAEFFPASEFELVGWTEGPCEEYRSTLTDKSLIEAACRSKTAEQVFGSRASFEALWYANESELADAFPSQGGDATYDASSADLALAAHLAFWTGKDCERIERLMKKSELARPKWEDREGWLRTTVIRAVSSYFGKVLGEDSTPVAPPSAVAPPPPPGVTISEISTDDEIRTGRQMLFPDHQREYFAGCIALPSMNRVFVPGHGILRQAGFRMIYDGPSFVLGMGQGSKSVRSSYEAFTGSEANVTPWAHGITFRPLGERLIEENGERFCNVWEPVQVDRIVGDATPFIEHIQTMLPNGNDAGMLISYLAACVQYPGQKFAWCPVVQGVQGNGKSTISNCVEYAIGYKYVHQGKASELQKDFNSWMAGRILVVVNDIKISSRRVDVMERIKPLITEGRASVEFKGVDATTMGVCCNFILTTNHKDALPLTKDERRFAAFFCAQQHVEDLARDGFTDDYFARMRAWLFGGGYAIVANYLHTVQIPAVWNPSSEGTCGRAPKTSSHARAISESLPLEAQHIDTAIEEGRRGFRDGWISTIAIRELLRDRQCNAAPRSFGLYMRSLGYVRHHALVSGRTTRSVPEEDGRPNLYLKAGHIALGEHDVAKIADLYCKAQGYAATVGAVG